MGVGLAQPLSLPETPSPGITLGNVYFDNEGTVLFPQGEAETLQPPNDVHIFSSAGATKELHDKRIKVRPVRCYMSFKTFLES
jgi:hypothetical protein